MAAKQRPEVPEYEAEALEFVREMLARIGREDNETALAFSGGKDSIVVLDLLARAATELQLPVWPIVFFCLPKASTALSAEGTVVTRDLECFVYEHLERPGYLQFQLSVVRADSLRDATATFLSERSKTTYMFLGLRSADPSAASMSGLKYSPATNGWPACMRVAPLLSWTYDQIWAYIDRRQLPYPDAYAHGCTSLGNVFDANSRGAVKNPALLRSNGTYAHARELGHAKLEREGRV